MSNSIFLENSSLIRREANKLEDLNQKLRPDPPPLHEIGHLHHPLCIKEVVMKNKGVCDKLQGN